MPTHSAGVLLYRFRESHLEVLLVHPGGPFWARKDTGAWSIPKGECAEGEDPLDAAKRELAEETGIELNSPLVDLGAIRQPSGKIVHAWAAPQDCDPALITSNKFTMEWPPKSGKFAEFLEVDRAAWYATRAARGKLHKGQVGFIDKLRELLKLPPERDDEGSGREEHGPRQLDLF